MRIFQAFAIKNGVLEFQEVEAKKNCLSENFKCNKRKFTEHSYRLYCNKSKDK